MNRTAYSWLCLLLCVCMTACRPTPDHEVVINRGEEDLQQLIQTTPEPNALPMAEEVHNTLSENTSVPVSAPAQSSPPAMQDAPRAYVTMHWNEEFSLHDGDARVIIDADVKVPEIDAWPVYAASRRLWQTADIERMCKSLAGDQPIFVGPFYPTKEYFKDMLLQMQASEEARTINETLAKQGLPTMEERILQTYEKVPESVEQRPMPWEEYVSSDDTGMQCHFYYEPVGDYLNFVALSEGTEITLFPSTQAVQSERLIRQGAYIGAEPGQGLPEPPISLEEAQKVAEAFLASLGAESLLLTEATKAQKTNIYTAGAESIGWSLTYSHEVCGIPCITHDREMVKPDAYAQSWPQESVSIYVDSKGVWYFYWRGACRIEDQLSEQTALLSFSSVQELIRQRLRLEYLEGVKELRVGDIRMGYCVLPQKDDPGKGYTIPVWVVNYEVDDVTSPPALYRGFAISALNGANIHLE